MERERDGRHPEPQADVPVRVLAEEPHRRAAGQFVLLLLLVPRHRVPMVVDRARLVDDRHAGVLEPIAELEIFMAVAGERFVEAADAVEFGLWNRRVAGQKVQP